MSPAAPPTHPEDTTASESMNLVRLSSYESRARAPARPKKKRKITKTNKWTPRVPATMLVLAD